MKKHSRTKFGINNNIMMEWGMDGAEPCFNIFSDDFTSLFYGEKEIENLRRACFDALNEMHKKRKGMK